jgi:hypothetical protein
MRLVVKKLLMIILTVVVHTMKDIIFNVRLRLYCDKMMFLVLNQVYY